MYKTVILDAKKDHEVEIRRLTNGFNCLKMPMEGFFIVVSLIVRLDGMAADMEALQGNRQGAQQGNLCPSYGSSRQEGRGAAGGAAQGGAGAAQGGAGASQGGAGAATQEGSQGSSAHGIALAPGESSGFFHQEVTCRGVAASLCVLGLAIQEVYAGGAIQSQICEMAGIGVIGGQKSLLFALFLAIDQADNRFGGDQLEIIAEELSRNHFSGRIPSSIGQCADLIGFYISLARNNFSGRGLNGLLGYIPTSIGLLQELRYLYVQSNRLTGGVPIELGECSDLSGSVPAEIGLISNLTELYVSDNRLTGVPSEVLYSPSPISLDASINVLVGTIPGGSGSGSDCRRLSLFDLQLGCGVPEDLCECSALRLPNISHNRLARSLIGDLHTLDLSFNSIPPDVRRMRSLSMLDLGSNGEVPGIGETLLFQAVNLNNMALRGSIPAAIEQCKILNSLNLSNNSFNGTIPASMGALSSLKTLDLEHNRLSGTIPPELAAMVTRRKLDLSFNSSTGTVPSELGGLSELASFSVSFNNLTGPIPQTGVPQTGSNRRHHRLAIGVIIATVEVIVYESITSSPSTSPEHETIGKFVLFSETISAKHGDWLQGVKALIEKHFVIGVGPTGTVYKAVVGGALLVDEPVLPWSIGTAKAVAFFHQDCYPPLLIFNFKSTKDREFVPHVSDYGLSRTLPRPDYESDRRMGDPVGYMAPEVARQARVQLDVYGFGVVLLEIATGRRSLDDKAEEIVLLSEDGTIPPDLAAMVTLPKLDLSFNSITGTVGGLSELTSNRTGPTTKAPAATNLVELEGYYWSSGLKVLLTKYYDNHSLYHHLHDWFVGEPVLPWSTRMKIAIGTANHDCYPPLLIFNLKSTNILLDREFVLHVSDYGLSRIPLRPDYESERRMGDPVGYMAPEVARQARVSEKLDVYGFGFVVLDDKAEEIVLLSEDVRKDEGLALRHDMQEREGLLMLRLGLACTTQDPSKRPTMAEAVQILEKGF